MPVVLSRPFLVNPLGSVFTDGNFSTEFSAPDSSLLSPTRVFEVVGYDKSTTTRNIYGKVRLVSGSTISLGTRSLLDATYSRWCIRSTTVGTDKILSCYDDNNNSGQVRCVVANISGQTITPGTAINLGSLQIGASARAIALGDLGTDKALLTIANSATSSTDAYVITVAGTVPTLSALSSIDGLNIGPPIMAKMDDGRHFFVYSHVAGIANRTSLISLSVSGTTVTKDFTQIWHNDFTISRQLYDVSNTGSDIFAILYRVNTTGDLTLHPVSWTSGDVYTDGTPVVVVNGNPGVGNATVEAIGSNRVFVTWSLSGSGLFGQVYQMNGTGAPTTVGPQLTLSTDITVKMPLKNNLGSTLYSSWAEAGVTNSGHRSTRIITV